MYENLHTFVRTAVDSFPWLGPVYEFGFAPLDMPGLSSMHDCFPDARYVNCQLYEEVVRAYPENFSRLPFADHSAGTVVCIDLFERLPQPVQMLNEVVRILKPGGTLLVAAAAANLPVDGDIACLQPQFLREILRGLEVTLVGWQGAIDDPSSIYGIAFKSPASEVALAGIQSFLSQISKRLGSRRMGPWRWADRIAWRLGIRHRWLGQGGGPVEFVVDLAGTCGWLHPCVPSPHYAKANQRLDLME